MKVRSLQDSTLRYVRGSLRNYLEGGQNLAWISGVILHSGLQLQESRLVFLELRSYGQGDRYRTLADWFDRASAETAGSST